MAGLNFDPFAKADPLRRIGQIRGLDDDRTIDTRPQRAEFRRPLPPAQADSFGKQVLGAGASGLNYVLGTLDKPGQAVRGLLAGKGASSLKHLVPFAASAGLTTEADHTSGRDLTDAMGVTTKGDKGWGSWGAGLAADLITDPLSYATFGAKSALTAGGKLAQKAGTLKGLSREALIQGGHSGLMRFGVPFGPGVVMGTGQTAQRVARGMDKLGSGLKYGTAVGRGWNALFDRGVQGAVHKSTQQGATRYLTPALDQLQTQAREQNYRLLSALDPTIKAGVHPESAITDAARAVAEGVPHNFDPGLVGDVTPAADIVSRFGQQQVAEARAAGLPLSDLQDPYAAYVHRQAIDASQKALQIGGPGKSSLYPVASGSNIGRDEILRGIPGGTNRINDWYRRFGGAVRPADLPQVVRAIKKDMVLDLQAGGRQITRPLGKQFDSQAEALASRLAGASPYHAQEGIGLFTPNLAGDFAQRNAQHARTLASAKGAIGTLSDLAGPMGAGMVKLPVALKRLGLRTYGGDPSGAALEGALVQMLGALNTNRRLGATVGGFTERKLLKKEVGKFGVSEQRLGELLQDYTKWKAPEQIKSPLSGLDSITNSFKALTYPIWAASHIRNAATAGMNNARIGTGLRDYLDQFALMTGRGNRDLSHLLPGKGAGLARADQIDAIRRSQFASGNIFGGHGVSDDIADSALDALRTGQGRFTPHTPGSDRLGPTGNLVRDTANLVVNEGLIPSVKGTARAAWNVATHPLDLIPTRWNRLGDHLAPVAIKGVGGAKRDALAAVRAGRTAGTNIEDFFRGAAWNKQVRSGATPDVAAKTMNDLHFDYDNLTQFERHVMRRLVPFYTYASRNLPMQLRTAASQPGIIQAQYKPFQQRAQDDGYVPQYLASGIAMPTGPEVDGKRQYISKLGLPAEEAFEKLRFANGMPDIRGTTLAFLGQMNPVLKAPLEQLFNTQFHTGRKLTDLRPQQTATAIGRLFGEENPQMLGQFLANTPLTRFVSSADKLVDSRKGALPKAANLLTGVRVTDVDTEKARAIDLRNALASMMEKHPHLSQYHSFYVKPDDVAKLTPDEIQAMRMYSQIQEQARDFAASQRVGIRPR